MIQKNDNNNQVTKAQDDEGLNFEFENDFGESPIIASVIKDEGFLKVSGIIGIGYLIAIAQNPIGAIVLAAILLNDIIYLERQAWNEYVGNEENPNHIPDDVQPEAPQSTQQYDVDIAARQTFGTFHDDEGDGDDYSPSPPSPSPISRPHIPSERHDGKRTRQKLETTLTKDPPIGLPKELYKLFVVSHYSTFIVGQSDAGKDILTYNLAKAIRENNPSAYMVGIDGKNKPGERPLWKENGLYDEVLHMSMLDPVDSFHDDLKDVIKLACATPDNRKAFVVFSELNGIFDAYAAEGKQSEWKEVAKLISYLACQGNGRKSYIIATAQALALGELGIQMSSRGNTKFLMLANATQLDFVRQVNRGTKVFDESIHNAGQFQSAISRSTALNHLPSYELYKGVAYYHQVLGKWLPMPRLNNPGGDRSAETMTSDEPLDFIPTSNESGSNSEDDFVLKVTDKFTDLANSLNHPGQESIKSLVLWLSSRKGDTVTYNQIKDNWARKNLSERSKNAIMTHVQFVVHHRLMTISTNNEWVVAS